MASPSPPAQYGIPPHEVKRLREEAAARAVRRQYFIKESGNPHRGHGYIFDESVQRYISLKMYQVDYFKPSATSAKWGIGLLLPFPIFGYLMWNDRRKRELAYRSGQVAYKDRMWKLHQ